MKKIILIPLLLICFFAKAQTPVTVSQPQKFLKWLDVKGSVYLDSVFSNSDSTTKAISSAWAKRNFATLAIKTINSGSLLGSGNILLQTPLTAGVDYFSPLSGIYSHSTAVGTGLLRSGAQLVASNYGAAPGTHALISIENNDKTDEGAITWYTKLSNGTAQQLAATYARLALANDDPSTFVSTLQTHLPGTTNGDNVTTAMYSNNTTWVNTGSLSNAISSYGAYQWDIVPPSDLFIVGGNGIRIGNEFALGTYTSTTGFTYESRAGNLRVADGATNIGSEIGYSSSDGTAFLQAYNRGTPGYSALRIQGLSIAVKGITTFDSAPSVVTSGNSTFNFDRGTTSTAAGITLKTTGTSNWGFGTAYGLSSTTDLSLYNFGLGTNALRVDYSTNAFTFSNSVTAANFIGPGTGLTGLAYSQLPYTPYNPASNPVNSGGETLASVTARGATTGQQVSFTAAGKAFTLVGGIGNPEYFSIDQTAQTGGKLFRIGDTGASPLGIGKAISFYNQTDNKLMLDVDFDGNGTFLGNATASSFTTTGVVITGGISASIRNIAAATTITNNDYTLYVIGTTTFTQPLPSTPSTGQIFIIVNNGTGTITVTATSIMGGGSTIINSGQTARFQYNGVPGTYVII